MGHDIAVLACENLIRRIVNGAADLIRGRLSESLVAEAAVA
jgi:hypothetical protein